MSQLSKGRGYRWETEVAKRLGGVRRNAGPGTDVEARGRVVECKSQQNDKGLTTLTRWIKQAKGYVPGRDDWTVAAKLGIGRKAEKIVIISLEEYERLTRQDEETTS